MKRTSLAVAAIIVVALLGSVSTAAAAPRGLATKATGKQTMQVFAAASLNQVFPKIAAAFKKVHKNVRFVFNFSGTDVLTGQIELGAQPDIFAGAHTKYADKLFNEGLIKPYKVFATNKLVVVTPASNPAGIRSLKDLTRSGTKIVIGDSTVPIGSYTRTVLTNLNAIYGSTYSTQVLKNVVAQMNDVTQVLNAVMLGEADAGFVYITDAKLGGKKVKTFAIVRSAQANPEYPIAALRAAPHARLARQFVNFVRGSVAQKILRKALFGPYPTY